MYSDAHARNNSAPGTRTRKERQSISDFSSLSIQGRGMRNISYNTYFMDYTHTRYMRILHNLAYIIYILGSPKKAKPKQKERKRKNTDPFQNFGMPLERF